MFRSGPVKQLPLLGELTPHLPPSLPSLLPSPPSFPPLPPLPPSLLPSFPPSLLPSLPPWVLLSFFPPSPLSLDQENKHSTNVLSCMCTYTLEQFLASNLLRVPVLVPTSSAGQVARCWGRQGQNLSITKDVEAGQLVVVQSSLSWKPDSSQKLMILQIFRESYS